MSLRVHTVKRKILSGPEAGSEKFYGQVRLRERVYLKELAGQISENTSATESDVNSVINGLVTVLSYNLKSGHIVELEDFGNFRLTAGSPGVEKKEDFKCWMMRSPQVTFAPGKLLGDMLKEVRFEWLPVVTEEGEVECDQPHG